MNYIVNRCKFSNQKTKNEKNPRISRKQTPMPKKKIKRNANAAHREDNIPKSASSQSEATIFDISGTS